MTYCIEFIILSTIVLYLLYKWSICKYNILQERGIAHEKPFPLIGNISLNLLLGKSSGLKSIIDRYRAYKKSKVYGAYFMRDCNIYIRDLDLIKKVGIKDFDIFPNHGPMIADEANTFITKSLIALKDQRWREMRNSLSPSFTGRKMRLMFQLVNECVIEAINYISNEVQATGKNEVELEMKDFTTRFTNDAIASTAFGINVNSFKDQNNEFFKTGKIITNFSGIVLIKALLYGAVPKIMKLLRIKLFDDKIFNYFNRLVIDTMDYRKVQKIVRPDMIHLLMEAKLNYEENKLGVGGDHSEFTNEDLLAQCMLFFIAGFDTVSACLCFTAYELLDNPEIQDRLYDEILQTKKSLQGEPLNYDCLMKMKYMDMVVSESLRKWPPAILTDRVCSTDYDLKDDKGHIIVKLKKGDQILVPIVGIHYDSSYYIHPEIFDPERFSDEKKSNIDPMSYLPFGLGPRMCIGNRLALMEVKALLYHILLNFKIVRTVKTSKNLMDSLEGFTLVPKEKFWMKFVQRD